MLLNEYRALGSALKFQIPASIADLLKNESITTTSPKIDCCTQTVNYAVFSKPAQNSLREALYYAVELGNLDIAYELSCFGVKWNVNLWAKCLTWAMEQKSGLGIKLFIDTFQINQLIEAPIFLLEEFCNTLFEAVEISLTESFINEDIRGGLLFVISSIFKHFNSNGNESQSKTDQTLQNSKSPSGIVIDSKYCNNEKYSDIQFIVEDRKIFAHRIVVSAHPKFEAALQNSGNTVRIDDVTYDVFKAIIEFVYGKQSECMQRVSDLSIQNQLKAIDLTTKFGLEELVKRIIDTISDQINTTSCVPVFVYACTSHNSSLLEMVEPFMLNNLEPLASTNEQREMLIELDAKYRLLKRLGDHLNRCFRAAYEKPQTLQQYCVQKF
ncbi:BTB domain-containing protein [Aphelenchoides bicaudatus]|nr:BTB domain-containing protein [Aphelenchoides bicaudatus]